MFLASDLGIAVDAICRDLSVVGPDPMFDRSLATIVSAVGNLAAVRIVAGFVVATASVIPEILLAGPVGGLYRVLFVTGV